MSLDSFYIRPAVLEDEPYLIEWLLQPGVLVGFPLCDRREVEDAARIWMSYIKLGAVLTGVCDGAPCGIVNLYIHPYKKLAHQSLFAIIVDEKYRGKGVGTQLLQAVMRLAKEKGVELLHLEVYEHNPAVHLYRKMGFKEYGIQRHFIKDEGKYLAKIMMQMRL